MNELECGDATHVLLERIERAQVEVLTKLVRLRKYKELMKTKTKAGGRGGGG